MLDRDEKLPDNPAPVTPPAAPEPAAPAVDAGRQDDEGGDKKTSRFKWPRRILLVLLLLAAAWGGYRYWHYRSLYPQTGDAYLHAHVVRVAPQVSGQVLKVPVQAHQHVEKGQLLLAIDPQPYKIAVDQAAARLDLAKQQAAAAEAAVAAARAEVARQEATLNNVATATRRTLKLVESGTLPSARGDDARAALKEARSALAASQAELQRAIKQRGTPGAQNAQVRAAAAALAQARLDLKHTEIHAPAAGMLGEIGIRPGAMVAPGEAVFPLVEDGSFWVDANYKETDLARIAPGQQASISIDIYPDKTFHGRVESVSPASGAAFSLLPPENATGNWVKVTQRFPVRLRISDADPTHPLRIGASCVVTIDTTSSGG